MASAYALPPKQKSELSGNALTKEISTSVERRQLAAKRITKIYEMHGVPCFGGMNISTRTKLSNRAGRPPNQPSKSTNPRTR